MGYLCLEGFKDGVPITSWELEDLLLGSVTPWEELYQIFSEFDEDGFGEMCGGRFRESIYEPRFRGSVIRIAGPAALTRLEYRTLDPRPVTYQEFVDIVSNKRRRSLKVAVHQRDPEIVSIHPEMDISALERQSLPDPKAKLAYRIAEEFLPGEKADQRKYYSLQYRCWPPPIFVPLLTIVQAALFAFYSISAQKVPGANGPVPVDSVLIYRNDKRLEVWRFALYALLHAGWWHLAFNLMVQLMIGVPLEMVHGSLRISLVYVAGVLAGSLGTSVFDSDVYLVGASGGVYALLAAHMANVLLNYSHIDCGLMWIVISVIIASLDVGFAIWDRYATVSSDDPPVSYVAHLAGAVAGLTLGLLVLKSFDQRLNQQCIWWLALSVYGACMLTAIIWNIFFI